MRLQLIVLALGGSLLAAAQARATVLPDACGDDKVKFNVDRQKGQPAPSLASSDKAMVVFVEELDKNQPCLGCAVTTRVGVDGAWVGANQGNSYFAVTLTPGEHHVCTDWQSAFGSLKSKIGLTSFTAEAGKTYYYKIKVTMMTLSKEATDRELELVPLTEDEGKYGIKAYPLSKSTPHS
jgi:hypothetical protein